MGFEEFLINAVLLSYLYGVNSGADKNKEVETEVEVDDIDDLFRSTHLVKSVAVDSNNHQSNEYFTIPLIKPVSSEKGYYKISTGELSLGFN